MDPVSIGVMTAVSMASTVAGGAVSAAGASQSASANAQAYQYQAAVSRLNAKIAKQNADFERATGEVEAQHSGMKSRFQAGRIRTTQAASGIDINSGTHQVVQEHHGQLARADQSQIRSNAVRRAYGHEVEAVKHTSQGQMYDASASNAKSAGKLAVLSSIIGTVSSVSSKWLQASGSGSFQALGSNNGNLGNSSIGNPTVAGAYY